MDACNEDARKRFWCLTSRRKRGLSGMKMTPTSAARAGKRHTRMKSLQLWNWNSVPMAKPQPGRQFDN